MIDPLDGPLFHQRADRERYQVRFWGKPNEYAAFSAAVEKEGLVIQDVFNDFMNWFCMASAEGRIQKQKGEGCELL